MAASDAECFFGRWIEFDDIALMIYRNQTIKRRFENRAFQSLARAQFLVDALLLRYVLQGVEPAQLAVRAGCAEWFHCLPDMNPRAVGPTQLVSNLPALVPDGGLDRRAAKQPPIVWMNDFHPRASAWRHFIRLHADQLRQGVGPAFESPIRACDHVRELRHDLRLTQTGGCPSGSPSAFGVPTALRMRSTGRPESSVASSPVRPASLRSIATSTLFANTN